MDSYQVEHKTINSTERDQYSVFATIIEIKAVTVSSDPKPINFENKEKVKGKNSLNFLIVFDQN